jgi:hypothetical protein
MAALTHVIARRTLVVLVFWVAAARADTSETRVERLPVVNVKVGGRDTKEDVFVYRAPPGVVIRDIQLHEIGRGGDAQYTILTKTEEQVRIRWRVAAHTNRVLGVVIDSRTAYLALEMTVTLEKRPPPPSASPNSTVRQQPTTTSIFTRLGYVAPLAFVASILATVSATVLYRFMASRKAAAAQELERLRRVQEYVANRELPEAPEDEK